MIIMAIVLLICPGIIAAEYNQRIRKVKNSRTEFFINCALFVFLINFADVLLIYLRGWEDFTFNTMTASFILKYMISSFVFAYIMPYVYKIITYIIGRYITGSINKDN